MQTGECLFTWEFPTAVKRVQWSEDDTRFLAVTEERMGFKGLVRVFELNRDDLSKQSTQAQFEIAPHRSKATVAAWTALDELIMTGHENGDVALWDTDEGMEFWEREEKSHADTITDLQVSLDGTWAVTSSKDRTAKAWSIGPDPNPDSGSDDYLTLLKTFTAEAPLNSASILPGKPYVRLLPLSHSKLALMHTHTGPDWRWSRSHVSHDDRRAPGPL